LLLLRSKLKSDETKVKTARAVRGREFDFPGRSGRLPPACPCRVSETRLALVQVPAGAVVAVVQLVSCRRGLLTSTAMLLTYTPELKCGIGDEKQKACEGYKD
jgi:hypothetical protein